MCLERQSTWFVFSCLHTFENHPLASGFDATTCNAKVRQECEAEHTTIWKKDIGAPPSTTANKHPNTMKVMMQHQKVDGRYGDLMTLFVAGTDYSVCWFQWSMIWHCSDCVNSRHIFGLNLTMRQPMHPENFNVSVTLGETQTWLETAVSAEQ